MLLALDANAFRKVDPGKLPVLKPSEGLLLVAVDTSAKVNSVRVQKDGRYTAAALLNYLDIGRTARLYVVEAGKYQWSEVNITGTWLRTSFKLSDDEEFRFEVQPGKITYSGDLIFRPSSFYNAVIHVSNRGLLALDWLETQHPMLHRQYPYVYAGNYLDPFPEFYHKARASSPAQLSALSQTTTPPKPGELPLAPRELWKAGRIASVSLNPGGDLLAEAVRLDDGWALDLIDLKAGTAERLAKSLLEFTQLQWKGDGILLAGHGAAETQQTISVYRIAEKLGTKRRYERLRIPRTGYVVDFLPDAPNHILFGHYDSTGKLVVHRVDISSELTLRHPAPSKSRLNHGVANDKAWLTDGKGQLRTALAVKGTDYVLMHGAGESFTEVLRFSSDSDFEPKQLSYDGSLIYGLTDEGRDQRDFVEFDPAAKRVTRTVYSKPGVDIVQPLFDAQRRPIGVRYYHRGQLVNEYFDQRDQTLAGAIRDAFPGRTAVIVDRSRDGAQLILGVEGSDEPPKLYHLDMTRRSASLIDEDMPGLANRRFIAAQVLALKSGDDLPIEAFLTLPGGQGRRPLVVLPHGGPIGVADRLGFDRQVQFLASLGYGVLQVNFRGSAGYGKDFREAGHRQFGTLIEDDIAAAINHALQQYPLDSQRICIVGASYGGYSALVSAIRWPERFRCAVSLAGVSDRMLFFTASDSGRSAEGRRQLEKVIGDPRTQQAEMMATSPLYRYDALRVPVMLVHGHEDLRVDFEHTRRLVRMLNIAGRPPVLVSFDDEGHGFEDLTNVEATWLNIAGFLQQHLGPQSTAAASPQMSR